MPFLYDAWYVAGWSEDLAGQPRAITILDRPVLLFRKSDGTAAAIGNRCPHRFAPLHLGKPKGDAIECPYHGLRFDGTGACVHNPHGDGKIPAAARVPSYPLVERHGALWIWMGDANAADDGKIVDITVLRVGDRPYKTVSGYLHVNAHYQLVIDNLLDLSHAQYLHPAFVPKPAPGYVPSQYRFEMKQEEDRVTAYFWADGGSMNPFYALQWGEGAPARGDVRNHMRWDMPGVLQLDSGMTTVGGIHGEGPNAPSLHLITPETQKTCHYFWSVSHNYQTENPMVTNVIKSVIGDAFQKEDEPMIAACQEMMGTTSLLALNPVLLPGDSAALRARRILDERIAQQTEAVRY